MSIRQSVSRLVFIVVLLVGIMVVGLRPSVEGFSNLPTRSLSLGDTMPSVVTTYTITWQYPANDTVGSMRFIFCDNGFIEDSGCTNPGGSFASSSLSAQSGETGFSILSQSADEILVGRSPAAVNPGSVSYTFSNVTNPGIQQRFFIRVLLYPTNNGTGVTNYASSVVSAIAEPITFTTEVPPELVFCVGVTIDPNCTSFTGNFIDYGDLSTTSTDSATSQFGVVTNASGGYVVTINGAPMTAGNNVITPLNPPGSSLVGNSQFGLNLRANTVPPIGQDPAGLGTSSVAAGYDTPNFFKYADGDIIAFAPSPTYFNTFTVTYIVNVSPSQPGGIYNTTIAFVCTAAF